MIFFKTFIRQGKKGVLLAGMSLLFLLMPAMAQSQDLVSKRINLNISSVPIKAAFTEIEAQSGIRFAYGEEINKYAAKK